ncbi:MAG: OmpH family outer membrane protein [Myxococcales bacterium]|nr:OmpH family outer membrane protein [Myxococcales bacterium]
MGSMERYLVVDMDRVLNESSHGKTALASLSGLLKRAEAERSSLNEAAKKAVTEKARRMAGDALAEHSARTRRDFEKRQGALRDALVGLASKVVAQLAKEMGASLVIERRAALVFDPTADVTDEVIRRVDAVKLSSGR